MIKITALYTRLSRDDELQGEINGILRTLIQKIQQNHQI